MLRTSPIFSPLSDEGEGGHSGVGVGEEGGVREEGGAGYNTFISKTTVSWTTRLLESPCRQVNSPHRLGRALSVACYDCATLANMLSCIKWNKVPLHQCTLHK